MPLEIDILVVGATARDVVVRHITGSPPDRVTSDIDIAVAVRSWAELDGLTASMKPVEGHLHSYRVLGVKVDVVPFDGVETPDRSINRPDDHTMNVLGFREALSSAVRARLPGDVEIRMPSHEAQAILKLVAWHDRHLTVSRDAVDLAALIECRSDGDRLDELYDEHGEVLRRNSFDPLLAGAEVLDAEGAAMLGPAARMVLRGILADEQRFDLLSAQMRGRIGRRRDLLAAYARGVA